MNCPTCGYLNTPGDAYCDHCGAKLPDVTDSMLEPLQPLPEENAPLSEELIVLLENQQPPSGQPMQSAGSDALALSAVPGFLVVQDTNETITLPMGQTEIFVGRNDSIIKHTVDIDLEPYGGLEHGVSRNHAKIVVEEDKLFVEILSATNLSYLNGQRLNLNTPTPLNSGDKLRFGSMELVYLVK